MSEKMLAATAAVLCLLIGCAASAPPDPVATPAKPAVREVMPPVLFEMMRDISGLAIIDVRPEASFKGPQGHLRHAINVPMPMLKGYLPRLGEQPKRTYVFYGENAQESLDAAAQAMAAGFPNALALQGGISNWLEHSYGTVVEGGGPPALLK